MKSTKPLSTLLLWLPPSLMILWASHFGQAPESYGTFCFSLPMLFACLTIALISGFVLQQYWICGDLRRWRGVALCANAGAVMLLLMSFICKSQGLPMKIINKTNCHILEARFHSSTQDDRMAILPSYYFCDLILLGHDAKTLQVEIKVSSFGGEHWLRASGTDLELNRSVDGSLSLSFSSPPRPMHPIPDFYN